MSSSHFRAVLNMATGVTTAPGMRIDKSKVPWHLAILQVASLTGGVGSALKSCNIAGSQNSLLQLLLLRLCCRNPFLRVRRYQAQDCSD